MNVPTQQTEGTMSAKSRGEPDFFTDTNVAISRAAERWQVSAIHESGNVRRALYFHIPFSLPGTGVEMTYPLRASDDKEHALAYYFSNDTFVPSSSGTLKIKYFAKEQRMIGSFDFEGRFGDSKFQLNDGQFDMTGINGIAGTKANASLTADLEGVGPEKFQSDTVVVLQRDGYFQVGAEQLSWGSFPVRLHIVKLYIRNDLKKGVHPIGTLGDPVYAAYTTSGGDDQGVYISISGKVDLKADPSEHQVLATLDFKGNTGGADAKEVTLTNGLINYQK